MAKTTKTGGGARKRAATGKKRQTASKALGRRSRSGKSQAAGLRRFFDATLRLALVSLGIFGVGLILGLYFSQSPPRDSGAQEAPREVAGGEPAATLRTPPRPPEQKPEREAYRLSPVPTPPKLKPQLAQRPETPAPPKAATTPAAPAAAQPPAVTAPAVTAPAVTAPAAGTPSAKMSSATPSSGAPATQAAWLRHAVAVEASRDKPWIAIVLDDVGVNQANAWQAIELPAPLTLAFMTYATGLERMTAAARGRGHELMVHFPMEPMNLSDNDPGENALLLDLSASEVERRLEWGLNRFDGYVGVNNHMGSRFTGEEAAMRPVMTALKRRGLLFLDSRTTAKSVAGKVAREAGLPVVARDVFLDHEPNSAFVEQQLVALEEIATRRGYAVGIGHPQDYTMEVLRRWLPEARRRGFVIVPLTAIVKRRGEVG